MADSVKSSTGFVSHRRLAVATLSAITALLAVLTFVASASAGFGIDPAEGGVFDGGTFAAPPAGETDPLVSGPAFTQAAGHPYEAWAAFQINRVTLADGSFQADGGNLRNVRVDLPPGLIGNPSAVPECSKDRRIVITSSEVAESEDPTEFCPAASVVGLALVTVPSDPGIQTIPAPVFNLQPTPGAAASFGFTIFNAAAILDASLRDDGTYGVSLRTRNANQGARLLGVRVALWGDPSDPRHDDLRCIQLTQVPIEVLPPSCSFFGNNPPGTPQGPNPFPDLFPRTAFLTNPTSCTPPGVGLLTGIHLEAWNPSVPPADASFTSHLPPGYPADPSTWGPPQGPTGCESVPFDPLAPSRVSSGEADSPSGVDVQISVPTGGLVDPTGTAQSNLKKAVVTLPEGMSVNPANANGLGACSPADLARESADSAAGAGCPNASKLGTVEIETPLLDEKVEGSVSLAEPFENQFNSLLALYIVAKNKDRGIVIKLAGRVDPDPTSGRLTATFDDNPQLPFSSLKVTFFSGPTAPLVTPQQCGSYAIETDLYPWARPSVPVHSSSSFRVTSGPKGGPCPAADRLTPSFEAGTLTPIAGDYSPLIVSASRPDGSQPLTGINLDLPPGLTGKLKGIPYCSASGIAQASARNRPGQGADEIASPSCPAASQVGTVDVAAGAGPSPYHAQGKAYLAGPYKGAPLSLLVITPAVAGPFDLGVVAVRAALRVDPVTARISAVSDPIPQILQGIPLKVRSISVEADRPGFTLNPTSCQPFALTGTLFGSSATAPVSSRFQVGACKALDFAPKLSLRVFGKTNRNSKPRFRAVLETKPGEANIARAQVNLPPSEFLEQNHIKTICTRVQFRQGDGHGSACPKGSIYGKATALTPLLDQPLQGPVYLRANGGERKLPDLVAALSGQVDIELQGKVDSGPNKGLRNTFEVVPDAPVSKFILEMSGGKKGLLVNSENLCSPKAKTKAIVRFVGQNGAVHQFKPKVANGCGKGKKKAKRG